jgi:hypothetical protein
MMIWTLLLLAYLGFLPRGLGQGNDLLREAECLYWQGDFAGAASLYRQILKEDPHSCLAHYGLGRSLLKDEKVTEAHQAAEEALQQCPSDPMTFSLAGDLFFREAEFQKSLHFYKEAITADPKNARGHFGIGKILLSEFNWKSAFISLGRAYELDPEDPEILFQWAITRKNRADKVALLEKYLKLATNEDPIVLRKVKSTLALYKSIEEQKIFQLLDPPPNALIKLSPAGEDPLRPRGYQVYLRFNHGDPHPLLLDSAASSIIIDKKTAEKNGVRFLCFSEVMGSGDEGEKESYFGWVDDIEIGPLKFKNCVVQVTEKKTLPGRLGVVNLSLFARYLIQLDYPSKRMHLKTLPAKPALPSVEEDSWFQADRMLDETRNGYLPVRGFSFWLAVETRIDRKKEGLFVFDSGSSRSLISEQMARVVTKTHQDDSMAVRGLSGKVNRVFRTPPLALEFCNFRSDPQELVSFDFGKLNKSLGTEISGLIGDSTLRHLNLWINYRDGLMKIEFKPHL